jgi:hypothetical protein
MSFQIFVKFDSGLFPLVHRMGFETPWPDTLRRPVCRNLFRRKQAKVINSYRSDWQSIAHLFGKLD